MIRAFKAYSRLRKPALFYRRSSESWPTWCAMNRTASALKSVAARGPLTHQ